VRPDLVISEVAAMAESTFPKDIAVETEVAQDIRFIAGDPTQINQVLLNLCVNARDALPDGGSISIAARNVDVDEKFAISRGGVMGGPYVVLEVSDNGIGMTQEIVDRIFEPFFTTKEPGKSTGLGLSTSFGIVRRHGGFLTVYSEPGRGSAFKAYFPAEAEDLTAPQVRSEPETLHRGNGELILVVDDEVSILSMTRETLEEFGYRVVTAEDGEHAIRLYVQRHSEIALVLTDMMMPIMDGERLIRTLRSNSRTACVPILVLTSNPNTRQGTSKADAVVGKPFNRAHLLATVKSLLGEGDVAAARV
jgi:CheY-like chemotaxis protein